MSWLGHQLCYCFGKDSRSTQSKAQNKVSRAGYQHTEVHTYHKNSEIHTSISADLLGIDSPWFLGMSSTITNFLRCTLWQPRPCCINCSHINIHRFPLAKWSGYFRGILHMLVYSLFWLDFQVFWWHLKTTWSIVLPWDNKEFRLFLTSRPFSMSWRKLANRNHGQS